MLDFYSDPALTEMVAKGHSRLFAIAVFDWMKC